MKSIVQNSILAALFLFFFHTVFSQSDCDGNRYVNQVFSAVTKTADVTFGSNSSYNGAVTSLKMDIYQPTGDTQQNRPLIVMGHGGSFLGGDKAGADIVPLANYFAKLGYVTASYNYRVGMNGIPLPGPDSTDAMEAVIRGVHDAKAAVRYFYKDVQNGNTYNIDTNRIFLLGSSAGAFISLHYAYLDVWSEVPPNLDTTHISLRGALEGNSGNPGYSTKIAGVVNLSGAIGDSSWIQPGDLPCVSLHGTADNVVPYGSAIIVLSGFYPLLVVDGSSSVSARMDHVGITNCFYTHYGAGHVPYVGNVPYTDTTEIFVKTFLAGLVCNTPPQCASSFSVANEQNRFSEAIQLWPNPASGNMNFSVPVSPGEYWSMRMYDLHGRTITNETGSGSLTQTLPLNGFSAGLYFVEFTSNGKSETLKFVVE